MEQGSPPEGVTAVRVPSRLIRPGTVAARVFHHVPQLGAWQRRAYRDVAAIRRPALVHAHYLTTGYLASGTRNAVVISAYGFDVSVMARRRLWRRAFHALASEVAAVLVEGPHMRDTVVSLGFPAERVRVVPIAVGHEHLPFTAPDPPGAPGPRLLVAGRFVEKKGIAIAIQALDGLRRRWPAATLEIVGSGRLEGELRAQARSSAAAAAITSCRIAPRVRCTSSASRGGPAPGALAAARNGDSEGGAPTTILDAQAVGTVVVGSTHADIPFLVEDGRTGFLAPAEATSRASSKRSIAPSRRPTDGARSPPPHALSSRFATTMPRSRVALRRPMRAALDRAPDRRRAPADQPVSDRRPGPVDRNVVGVGAMDPSSSP